jgi:DNA repair protein RecO (recombination protein O)
MEWQDEGIVLQARPHGETDSILTLLTFEHGRHLGLVKGGASRKARPALQPGNRLTCRWRARLQDHLGHFAVEPVRLYAALLIDDRLRLAAAASAAALVDATLAEREPHPELFAVMVTLMSRLATAEAWPEAYVRFELLLLATLGYGLDLSACAVTGATTDLTLVSPRTGRAVSTEGAGEFAPRLLPLPAFLVSDTPADDTAVAAGLKLAGHFLDRHILEPSDKEMPLPRARFAELWRQRLEENP